MVRPLFTVLVPTYNEAARIASTISHWRATKLLEAYPCIIADDGSSDETVEILTRLVGEGASIRILKGYPHRSKLTAIARGLDFVESPYVLCLDADTWFEGDVRLLQEECARLAAADTDVAAFRLEPRGNHQSLVVDLQACEYAFMCDAMRRLFGHVGTVNGAASLWRTSILREVLAQHTLVFEGDDLEATIIAHRLSARVVASRSTFCKAAKPTFRALARQRVAIWDTGLFDVLRRRPPVGMQRGPEAAFLTCYMFFEAALHPAKVLSFAVLLASLMGPHWFGPQLEAVGKTLTVTYLAALAIAATTWLVSCRRIRFQIRSVALFVALFGYPTIHLWLTFSRMGVLAYFATWWVIAALQSRAITNEKTRRKAIKLSPLLPLYFLTLTLGFRSAALARWLFLKVRLKGATYHKSHNLL